MTSLTTRLRSVLIALGLLALSAGVALAGHPSAAAVIQTHDQVNQESESASAEPSESAEIDEDNDASETPDASESEGADAPEGADSAPQGSAPTDHPDNHGKLVSEAAQAATPAEFENHGAYVRTVAKANHGHDAAKPKHGGRSH